MVFRFFDCELDEERFELRRAGAPVALQPKVLAVLLHLVRHRDRVVTKSQLLDSLWPSAVVTESSLTRAVSLARRAIGDRGESSRAIRTITRRGYQFIAPTQVVRATAGCHASDGDPFVDRVDALERLRGAWGRSAAGRGTVALVRGPPGIGKTRLAEELAGEVRRAGGRAWTGWCARGAPPYWPWIQAVRAHVSESGPRAVRTSLGQWAESMASLVPELGSATSAGLPETDGAGFRVLETLAAWLVSAAAKAPVLLVLDDLHWADRASLRALAFAARAIVGTRVLLVATYRDNELHADHPLSETLGQLVRLATTEQITLDALGPEDVVALVELLGGRPATEGVLERLIERTGGNPLFVREVVRHLVEKGWYGPDEAARFLPPSIQTLVASRLADLPRPLREILSVAAIVGREFDVDLLASVLGMQAAEVVGHLDEIGRTGLVRLVNEGRQVWAIEHPIVHEALVAQIAPADRVRLHGAVARVLEQRHSGFLDPVVSVLAEHLLAAAPAGGPVEPAVRHAARAATLALRNGAVQDATRSFERALEVAAFDASVRRTWEGELLLGLAHARWLGGEVPAAVETAKRAAAAGHRDLELLGRAALVASHIGSFSAAFDDVMRLLKDAEGSLRGAKTLLRARVVARLAAELAFVDGTRRRRAALAAEATAFLKRHPDVAAPVSLHSDLLYATWTTASHDLRLAASERLVDECERTENVEHLLLFASPIHLTCLLEGGDAGAARREVGRRCTRVDDLGSPDGFGWYPQVYQTTFDLLEGRFADAERRATGAFDRARESADLWWPFAVQVAQLRMEQGRLHEALSAVRAAVEHAPKNATWRAALARCLLETGAIAEARRVLANLAQDGLPDPEDHPDARVALFHLSCCVEPTDAAGLAEAVHDRLRLYAELHAVPVGAWMTLGSVGRALGRLARVMGDLDGSAEHLERALAANTALGSPPLVARTEVELAGVLLARGAIGDHAAARSLVESGLETARRLGMDGVAVEAEALQTQQRTVRVR